MASTSTTAQTITLRSRIASFFRRRTVRAAIVVSVGYQVYHSARNYSIVYKPFSASRHRLGETVLDLNLDVVSLVHHESIRPLSAAEELRTDRLIDALARAKEDPRVTGLVVRGLSGLDALGLADLTELRNAISDFSQGWGGKHTMLHIPDGLASWGNGTVPLFFASVFDSVHVPPATPVIVPGISMATLFFKRLLGKLGLRAVAVARKDFKTAANQLTEEEFTAPHRESTKALLDAIMAEIVSAVAKGRNLSEEEVRAAIDDGIMTATGAHEAGLIDTPLHRDELPAEMRRLLREAEGRRGEGRLEAEKEWRAAMQKLREEWNAEGSAIDLWADGTIDANLADFNFAFPMTITLTDSHQERMRLTTEAEIAAMEAHIKWLDTRPWEHIPRCGCGSRHEQDAYRKIPYAAALFAAERRLCEHAVRTLKEFPKLVDEYRNKDDGVLELDLKEVGRWMRSVWKAKCMAARMVGTLHDVEEVAVRELGAGGEKVKDAELNEVTFKPRSFFADDIASVVGAKGEGEGESVEGVVVEEEKGEEEQKEALSEGEEGEGLAGNSSEGEDPSSETEDSETTSEHKDDSNEESSDEANPGQIVHVKAVLNVPGKKEDKYGMKLQYMRMVDYIEMTNNERRAYVERDNPPIRYEVKNPFPFVSGLIDYQDRNMLVNLQSPRKRASPWRFNVPKGNIVAVIHMEGVINDEDSEYVRTAIRRADKDPHVKAIVLRIDSPGGSAVASDIISRAVDVAEKPVVASMGSMCASGGYYVAAPCNMIFASPMTITGSIGVILQSFNSSELFERIGITSDSVDSGQFAKYFGTLGLVTEWSEEYAKRINMLIDTSYDDFVSVVAKGRGLGAEETEAAAQGRVWAGSDAVRMRLVDRVGGLKDAIEAAADLARLAPDAEVRAVEYPTVGMLVQEVARKRGFIPANLDEEGDEISQERKRKWGWGWWRGEEEEEEEERQFEQGEVSLDVVGEHWGIGSFVVGKMVVALDRLLMRVEEGSVGGSVVNAAMGRLLQGLGGKVKRGLSEELDAIRATAGRPAAIAPNFHLDDSK